MSESAEVKRGLLGRTRPLLSCTLRLRWLESVCAPRHFDFTGRRSGMCSSCTRRSLPFRNALAVCHAVWTGSRTHRWCVTPSSQRYHTTTTAATAGTLSDSGRIRSGASKIVPTVPLTTAVAVCKHGCAVLCAVTVVWAMAVLVAVAVLCWCLWLWLCCVL